MRIRTIKPEWLEDEELAAASDEARVLSVALILMSDDHGRGRASIATIAAETWRYALERNDGADAPEVLAKASRALRELVEMGFVMLYSVRGQRYFEIHNWKKHQKVDKPSAPRVPAPEEQETPTKPDTRDTLATPSRASGEGLASDLDPDPDLDHRPGPLPACAPERGESGGPTPMDPLKPQRGILLRAHRRRYSAATGHDVPPAKNSPADIAELLPWLVGYAQRTGQSFEQAVEAILERWWGDPYAASKGWPLWHLAKHVDEFAEALPPVVAKANGGMVPVSSRADHAADAAEGTQF